MNRTLPQSCVKLKKLLGIYSSIFDRTMETNQFSQIQSKWDQLSASFEGWKSNPGASLLKDKLKGELISFYEELVAEVHPASIKEDILFQPVEPKPEVEVSEIESELDLHETENVEEETSHPILNLFNDLVREEPKAEELETEENIQHTEADFELPVQQTQLETSIQQIEPQVEVLEEELPVVEKLRVPLEDKIEEFKSKPIESLANSIPIGKKFEFIEDLFIGNSDEYNHAIRSMDAMYDYKEAEDFLMLNYFDKFGWMEKEKVLNNLFDFVSRRFTE